MTKVLHSSITTLLLLFLAANAAMAQDDVEYKWEIGGGLGLTTYTGDFNGSIFSGSSTAPSFSVIARRTFNPYSHLRFTVGYATLKGTSKGLSTYYPDHQTGIHRDDSPDIYTFSTPLIDAGAIYEYNFQPYGTGREYRGAQRLSPFIALGLGFTSATDSKAFTINMPLGMGVKYKLGSRTNLACEWIMHFTLNDELDGVRDPYYISSSGMFKNTDCYSNLQVSLTYSFGPKCRTCMNSDWY